MAPTDPDLHTTTVTDRGQLERALGDSRNRTGVTLVQAVVPKMDVPALLAQIAQEATRANARAAAS